MHVNSSHRARRARTVKCVQKVGFPSVPEGPPKSVQKVNLCEVLCDFGSFQRERDDNEIKFAFLIGPNWGERRKSSENTVCLGKRHDNYILELQIILSRIL